MAGLQVPLAFSEEYILLSPEKAQKGKTYYCPSCEEPVILKKGDKKVAHFAQMPQQKIKTI